MDNHEQIYKALDLRKREVRVLQIQPSSDRASDIHCTLSKVEIPRNSGDKLECSHKYNALSYVWGNHEPPGIIYIHGGRETVTPNLMSALRHLRHPEKVLLLWVDAVCINQALVEEKNHQVAMMGEIYSCADKCFMWLGEEADGSGLAIDLIKRLSTWLAQHPISTASNFERHIQNDRAFDPAWQEAPNDPTNRPHFIALEKLLRREYWSRVRIVQEILLSQDAIMRCSFHHGSLERS